MSKVLLDTNFLIYSIDQDSKYFHSTQDVLSNTKYQFFTTSKNIAEFLAVITRLPSSALKLDEALSVIDEFKSNISIIYPTEESDSLFTKLLEKYKPVGIKIHDFEIVSIGLANNISTIATFNKKDFEEITEIEIIKIA